MQERIEIDNRISALLVIDVQNDFLRGGTLAVPDGEAVVEPINRLGQRFTNVILTQDWHPPLHISFGSTHGLRPFADMVQASYGEQALWPDHCVQGSTGAAFHAELDLPHAELIVRKGLRKDVDSYSAFLENDRSTGTGLAGFLKERGLRQLYLCGLAWDYCVGNSAIDGRAFGFEVTVIADATRGIAETSMAAMNDRWRAAGVRTLTTAAVL